MSNGLRWTQEEWDAFQARRTAGQRPPPPVPGPATRAPDPFLSLLAAAHLPAPVCEVLFLPDRDYRADYLWPLPRIIVEQQGHRDHSTRKGLRRDYEKANLAQIEGFIYLQFTPKQLRSLDVLPLLRRAFESRGYPREILEQGPKER